MGGQRFDAAAWSRVATSVRGCLYIEPVALIAFGSRANGFTLPQSDYALYVIGQDHAQDRRARLRIVDRAKTELGVALDLHGCSPHYAHSYRTFDPQLNAALRAGA